VLVDCEVSAGTSVVEEIDVGELQKELARLEVAEAALSAERSRLHHQIDFGFEHASTRARERQVSDERQELHRRIDELRERLGAQQIA
jgi:hypothetical protein